MIALFTALIGPYFIDWTNYKTEFETQASRIIGQNVEVGGNAEVRILPLPSVSFTDLAVGRNADGSPMLTVERFSANVELMPFLSGEIRIVAMDLDAPQFNFELDENGKIAWTNREQPLVDPGQVKLDRMTIRNGGFSIAGLRDGENLTGSGISANVSASSLVGPWRFEGQGDVEGENSRFDISTGIYSDGNPLRLKISGTRGDQPYSLLADGQVSLIDDVLSWSGEFAVDPVAGNGAGSPVREVKQPLPVKTEGNFTLTPTNLQIPQYRMEIGSREDPFVLTGQGRAQLRGETRFRLEVDGRQIDVERIAKMREGQEATAETMESRLALLRSIVNQIPIPSIDGEIDLEIPAIIAGETYIREVSALVKPFGDSWEIARLTTSLPGNTQFEAGGRLGTGENFGFHGKLLVASRQPSGFAAWAVGRVDQSIRKLNVAGFSADVTLTGSQTSLEQLELFLDNNRLTGSVNRLAPVAGNDGEQGTPAIVASLSGNRVSVDDLRALVALVVGGESDTVDSLALSHDFDVQLKAEEFLGFGVEAKGLDTQFQFADGALSIARLNAADFYGTQLQSQGQISDLLAAPVGNLSLSVAASDLSELAGFVSEKFEEPALVRALAANPELSRDASLTVEIDSSAVDASGERQARSRVLASGVIGGTGIQLRGGLKGTISDPSTLWMDVSGEFENADANRLAEQLGLQEIGFSDFYGGLEGPAKVTIESVGDEKSSYSTLVSASIPGTVISAKGIVRRGEESLESEFEVTAGSEDFSPVAAAFGYLLPGMNSVLGDEVPLSFTGRVSASGGKSVELDISKASMGGNAISGTLKFDELDQEIASVEGSLAMSRLSLPIFAAGLMGFEPELIALGGFASADESVFSGLVVTGYKGRIAVNAEAADLGTGENARNVSLELALQQGKTEITNVMMDWLGGTVSGSATLGQIDGTATLAGQYSATGLATTQLLRAAGAPDFADGKSALSGTIEATGKTPAALMKSLSGSGVWEFSDSEIKGVSASGLETVLAVTDQEGFEISPTSVNTLAEEAFLGGAIELQDGLAPFALSNGELRFRNITLADSGNASAAPALGDLTYDLVSGESEASITIYPDPKAQAVDGASPEVTFKWSGAWTGAPELLERETASTGLQGFLSIRAFEAEQRRVELLQASILEKQRFQRDLLNSGERSRWLQAQRIAELKRLEEERKAREEAERLAREEAERKAQEEAERQARLEEEARIAKEKAAEAARLEAERLAAEKREAERLEAERLQAEQTAAENARSTQGENATQETKEGVEVRNLPSPTPGNSGETGSGANVPRASQPQAPRNIFENIEQLLKPQLQ